VTVEGRRGQALYARVWPAEGPSVTFTAGVALTNVIRVE